MIQQNNYKKQLKHIDDNVYDDTVCNICMESVYLYKNMNRMDHIDHTGHVICYQCKYEIKYYNKTIHNNEKTLCCYLLCYFKTSIIDNNEKNKSYFFEKLYMDIILKYMKIIDIQFNKITKSMDWDIPNIFMKFENPNEYIESYAVSKNGDCIKHIKNPSEKIQLIAVNQDIYGSSIEFIEHPSLEVELTAIRKNETTIKYIKDPSEYAQLVCVTKYPNAVIYIKNPSEKVQIAAINNGFVSIEPLICIKNLTEGAKLAVNMKEKKRLKFYNTCDKIYKLLHCSEKKQIKKNSYSIFIENANIFNYQFGDKYLYNDN